MQLDSMTLLVAASATLAILGCALAYFWYRDRRSRWLLWWGLSFIAGGISTLGYTLPNWESDVLVIGVSNAVRVACLAMLWQGLRVFNQRNPLIWVTVLMVATWLALCLIPPFFASLQARIVAMSALQAMSCLLAAWELWRGRAEPLPSRTPAIVGFLSFAALMLVRIVGVNDLPVPMGSLPIDPLWMGGFTLAVFGHAMFLGFLMLALTKERLELEQRQIALVDPLTGLMNRRAFMAHVERIGRRRGQGAESTALLVLDLDGFKAINDRHGHEVGDKALAAFAALAEARVRPTDLLYRIGGEEFCFVLPDTRLADAVQVAERIRRACASSAVETARGERVLVTVSIGVATADFAGFDMEVLLAAADAALYEAKARGRNRVVVAEAAVLAEQSAVPASSIRCKTA